MLPRDAYSTEEEFQGALRDYAAIQFLQGLYIGGQIAGSWSTPEGRETASKLALMQADAFLKARGQ